MGEITIEKKKEQRERSQNSGQAAFKQPRKFAETDTDFSFDDRLPRHTETSYDHRPLHQWEKESRDNQTRGFDQYPNIKEIISGEPDEEFVFLLEYNGGQWIKVSDLLEDVYESIPFHLFGVEKGRIVEM